MNYSMIYGLHTLSEVQTLNGQPVFFIHEYPDCLGWIPAFYGGLGLLGYVSNIVRQQVVKLKLTDELIPSEDNKEIFNYPKMAMTREDLYDKTLSLEDQIQYFKSHEDELERRIIMLLESDTFFFTSTTELDMKVRDTRNLYSIHFSIDSRKALRTVS